MRYQITPTDYAFQKQREFRHKSISYNSELKYLDLKTDWEAFKKVAENKFINNMYFLLRLTWDTNFDIHNIDELYIDIKLFNSTFQNIVGSNELDLDLESNYYLKYLSFFYSDFTYNTTFELSDEVFEKYFDVQDLRAIPSVYKSFVLRRFFMREDINVELDIENLSEIKENYFNDTVNTNYLISKYIKDTASELAYNSTYSFNLGPILN